MGERNPPHLYKTYRWRKDRAVLLLLLLLSTLLSRVLLRREKKLCLYFYSPVVIKQPGAHHRHVTRSEDIRTGNISCINTTELFYRFVPFKKKKVFSDDNLFCDCSVFWPRRVAWCKDCRVFFFIFNSSELSSVHRSVIRITFHLVPDDPTQINRFAPLHLKRKFHFCLSI